MKISALILSKNEERNIENCLKSLDFCDEIIMVDDFSEDKTKGIVKSYELNVRWIKILKRKMNGDFAAQRNFGMEKAKNEWVLFIDADEEITKELKEEIVSLNHSFIDSDLQAFKIKRRDFFWGQEMKYGETAKIRNRGLLRLVKKGSGKWVGKVHEEFKVKNLKSKVKSLKCFLNHYPHQTVKDFLNEINFYSTIRARELSAQGKKPSILEIIFFPLGKFLFTYFVKLGFLDGPPGFVYAFFMSFHSFLVRAKLYQYTKINKLSS